MEASMYEDTMQNGMKVKQLKSKMTLDFNGSNKAKKLNGLLASPDLNICTLASPELERIIIQQNGMVTTTPTPTQFLFPKSVTEEQEAYARGFVDALAELHKTTPEDGEEHTNDGSEDIPCSTTMTTLQPVQSLQPGTSAMTVAQSQHVAPQVMPTTSSTYNFNSASVPVSMMQTQSAPMPTVVSSQEDMTIDLSRTSSPMLQQTPMTQVPVSTAGHQRLMQMKEEPQTVPCYNTPPMSPIDMGNQERIKLERKRSRNRVAARKCRYRKLERISRLEERVAELTGQKNQLSNSATNLRDQVARLKQQIMEHVNSGCKVMLNSNVL